MEIVDHLFRLSLNILEIEKSQENSVGEKLVEKVIEKMKEISPALIGEELTEEQINALRFEIQNHYDVELSSEAIVLGDNKVQRWFDAKKTEIDWGYWSAYKENLLMKKRERKVIDENEKIIDSILDFSGDPKSEDKAWSRKGLVMGNVQSGKTQNYIGLINKAFDCGYKVVILLGGHMNELRKQTQIRIDEDVIGLESKHLILNNMRKKIGVSNYRRDGLEVATFTSTEGDFSKRVATSLNISFSALNAPVIITVKKNTTILKNLINYITESSALEGNKKLDVPMLLIDDEADYASVNGLADRNRVSRTNEYIRSLLNLFHKNHYVGYTATPFANVFIDPKEDDEMLKDDLFPKDYMVRVPVPESYSGQDFFFGDNSIDQKKPPIVLINDNEGMLPLKHNKNTEISYLSQSLKDAIMSFVISTSARMQRPNQQKHNTMMINITHLKDLQNELKKLVDNYVEDLRNSIDMTNGLDLNEALENKHISELHRVYESYFDIKESFQDIRDVSNEVIGKLKIYAINNQSDAVLDYSVYEKNGLCAIAIGGYKLSRGLTLEGLTVSYFARNSKMYDTLMQMCRWFGYRPGYQDVCKVFLPKESLDWYKFISTAINDLYAQLQRMKDQEKTPSEFGLQVRSHPGALMVTARNKRGTGEERIFSIDLWGSRNRRFVFRENNQINNQNFKIVEDFLSSLEYQSEEDKKDLIFKDVEHNKIISLIENTDLLEDHIPNDALIDFIKKLKQNEVPNFRVTIKSLNQMSPNIKWMSKTEFQDEWNIANHNLTIPRRKMESNGVKISNPSSELGGDDDEKLLFNRSDREEIMNDSNFKPNVNDSFIWNDKRDFPGLIIYFINVRTLKPYQRNLWKDDLSNLEVNNPFEKPAVGFSLSFPLAESSMRNKNRTELKRAINDSKKLYTQNWQKQLEMEFDIDSTYEEIEGND